MRSSFLLLSGAVLSVALVVHAVAGSGRDPAVGDDAAARSDAVPLRQVAAIGPRASTGWVVRARGARVARVGPKAAQTVRFRQGGRARAWAQLAAPVPAAREVRVTALLRVVEMELRRGERRELIAVGTGARAVRVGIVRSAAGALRWALWREEGDGSGPEAAVVASARAGRWVRVSLVTTWSSSRALARIAVGRRSARLPPADLTGSPARSVTIGLGPTPASRGRATVLLKRAAVRAAAVSPPASDTRSGVTPPGPPAALVEAPARPLLLDGFDGDGLDARLWGTCHWWGMGGCTVTGSNEVEWYLPEQVSVGDGLLRLTAERRDVVGTDGRSYPYVSGMISSGPSRSRGESRFAFLYGRAEMRARVPAGEGTWSAFWLLPASGVSRPEIDVMEILGRTPEILRMHVHLRAPDGALDDRGQDWVGDDLSAGWHTYAIDWRPGVLSWSLDGVERWRIEGPEVPSEPMYLVANLAVGGDWAGPPNESRFPATLLVDEIRVMP